MGRKDDPQRGEAFLRERVTTLPFGLYPRGRWLAQGRSFLTSCTTITDWVLASTRKPCSHAELFLPHLEDRHILVQRSVSEARHTSHVDASHLEEYREIGHQLDRAGHP